MPQGLFDRDVERRLRLLEDVTPDQLATGSAWTLRYSPLPVWVDVPVASLFWTQSATNITKTSAYAAYSIQGKRCRWQGIMTATGAGSAGGTIQVGLPFAADTVAAAAGIRPIGTGVFLDQSAAAYYRCIATMDTAVTMRFLGTASTAANFLGAADFTAAIAANDFIAWDVEYELA